MTKAKSHSAEKWLLKVFKSLDDLVSDPLYDEVPDSRLKVLLTETWSRAKVDLSCMTEESAEFLTPKGLAALKREYNYEPSKKEK